MFCNLILPVNQFEIGVSQLLMQRNLNHLLVKCSKFYWPRFTLFWAFNWYYFIHWGSAIKTQPLT